MVRCPATPGLQGTQNGAWLLPDQTPLVPELEAFLAAGEPPVYVGFGSMPVDPQTGRMVIEAVRAARRRVALPQGWAELGRVDDAADGIASGDVNQQALLPRGAAMVHHGGQVRDLPRDDRTFFYAIRPSWKNDIISTIYPCIERPPSLHSLRDNCG